MKTPEGLGCCPSHGTPFPCASSSLPASVAASLWRSFPCLQTSRFPRAGVLCVHHGARPARLRLAATRSWQKSLPFSGPQEPGRLPPPSCWRGPFPARDQQQPRQRRQEAKPLLMLFHGAPVRPPAASRLFRTSGVPPSARAQCLTRGRGSDSCQRRRRWRRPSVCAEEKPETDPLALPLPFPA